MIPAAINPFLEQTPLCVRTRTTLECLFRPERLDALFRNTAQRQYHKDVLFSQVVELMLSVVLRLDPASTPPTTNAPPRIMTLELALEFIEEDELVEVTPKGIRMRKMYLKENDRKKYERAAAKV